MPVRTIVFGCISAVVLSVFRALSNDRRNVPGDYYSWTWIDVVSVSI